MARQLAGLVLAVLVAAAAAKPLITTPANLLFPQKDDKCDDGVFCNGIERTRGDGSCYVPAHNPCDDSDPTTTDHCMEATMTCHYVVAANAQTCNMTCTPDCAGKACGEDGCSGFCGTCSDGLGCLEGKCVAGANDGTCGKPLSLVGTRGLSIVNVTAGKSLTLTQYGDTSKGIHIVTPLCNAMTASPELFYQFEVPKGRKYGYDIRTAGYDTVVQLIRDNCASVNDKNHVDCNDDGTPPGDLGSRIQGWVTEGTWYIMVDGYSSKDFGNFTLSAKFADQCLPQCDGNFCGSDSCGGTCGDCGDGEKCSSKNNRCYADPCTPNCGNRTCGDDGCGGSCGTCGNGSDCIGEGYQIDDATNKVVSSYCFKFPVCDNHNPVCKGGCTKDQFCGRDCECHNLTASLPDYVVETSDLTDLYFEAKSFPDSACALVEKCVSGPGQRKLLRFTSSAINQGQADFDPTGELEPKDRPDIYEWGACHGHWHYKAFMQYFLMNQNKTQVILKGNKAAYCLEDSRQYHNGSTVNCRGTYDCGHQGNQRGWLDSYGWSLDCSWLDVTDVPPGKYVLVIEVNPDRIFQEVTFDNNAAEVNITIPATFPPSDKPVAMKAWLNSLPNPDRVVAPVGLGAKSSAATICGAASVVVAALLAVLVQ